MALLGDVGQLVGGLALALGVPFALFQYWRGQRHQQVQWLAKLYAQFYEQASYQKVRAILANREQPVGVAELFQNPEVTNYLNFFELLAYYVDNNVVKWRDAEALFNWWLSDINRYPGLRPALTEYGFEKLDRLLGRHYGAG